MTTKGDANPTADPVPVHVDQVRGIGRLLVRWAGLPLIWAMTGQFLLPRACSWLVLLACGRWPSRATTRTTTSSMTSPTTDRHEAPRIGAAASGGRRASRPSVGPAVDRLAHGPAGAPGSRSPARRTVAIRAAVGVVGAGALLVPGTSAAFSATTRTTGVGWAVPAYSYTDERQLLRSLPLLEARRHRRHGRRRLAATAAPAPTPGTYTRGVVGGTPDTSPNTAVTATTSTACVTTTSTTASPGRASSPRSSGSRPRPATPAAAS